MQVKAAMNKSVVTAVAFAGFVIAGPALAADLSYTPPVPTFSWTGVYVGVHAGAGWSLNEQSFSGAGGLVCCAVGPISFWVSLSWSAFRPVAK